MNEDKTVEVLWYVRFPGCHVPHYFFWRVKCGWSDPSVPDPDWSVESLLGCKKVRVKKLIAAPKARDQPFNERLRAREETLGIIEQSLVHHGLGATLKRFQAHARAAGKLQAWKTFTRPLLKTNPSGAVPRAPPVYLSREGCLATKIALLLDGQDVEPYTGEESWTRNDDALWDVVSDGEHGGGAYACGVTEKRESIADENGDIEPAALYRRDSVQVLASQTSTLDPVEDKEARVWAWLSDIDTTFSPSTTPLSVEITSLADCISPPGPNERGSTSTCPFCSQDWSRLPAWEKAAHVPSHSHISAHPQTATWTQHVLGKGVKRRHSHLTSRTLDSYDWRYGRGAKRVRVGSARSLAGSLRQGVVHPLTFQAQKATWETSLFSKERARAGAMHGLQVGCG